MHRPLRMFEVAAPLKWSLEAQSIDKNLDVSFFADTEWEEGLVHVICSYPPPGQNNSLLAGGG